MMMPSVFEKYRADIDGELRAALSGYVSPMYDMLRYHLGWIDERCQPMIGSSGKALRPTLCLLACEVTGGNHRRALPAAASLELIHNFSLIHDDIQDDDRERRHRPTVWSLWGKPQAINAGTAMRVIASLTALRLEEQGFHPQKVLRIQNLLDRTCLRLIEGQYLDISYESRLDVGVNDYLTMVEGKTASLIACSLETGAMLGTDDELVHKAFRNFGLNLGLAFQIQDDVLGIWGDEAKTGKPVGNDILRRKKSFPIVFALEKAEGVARAKLVSIYRGLSISEEGAAAVLRIIDEVNTRAEARRVAEQCRTKALMAIQETALSPYGRQNLEEMANFLTQREF